MQAVYKKIATPHKLGAVIKWENYYADSPTVLKKRRYILHVFYRIGNIRVKGEIKYEAFRNTYTRSLYLTL